MPYPTRRLSTQLAHIAHDELNETPDRIAQDLIILRVWMRQRVHLRARSSDEFLIAFLRRCRYSLEETKKRIDRYFSVYGIFPEFLSNRHVSQTLLDFNRSGVVFLPERPRPDNQVALLIIRLNRFDLARYQVREMFRYFTMIMEMMALENDNASICGVCKILDFDGTTGEQLEYLDRTIAHKWTFWLRDCCPLRFREIYFLNAPKEIQRLFAIRRTFFMWRGEFPVILLKDLKELHKHIPRDCLPEEYGGSNGHCAESVSYVEDLLQSYRGYFERDSSYGTNEALRGGEVQTYEAEFGASGSFRQLSSD